MRLSIFKTSCDKCNKIIDVKEDRYILLLEDRHNQVRSIFHKHIIKKHYHLKCIEGLL